MHVIRPSVCRRIRAFIQCSALNIGARSAASSAQGVEEVALPLSRAAAIRETRGITGTDVECRQGRGTRIRPQETGGAKEAAEGHSRMTEAMKAHCPRCNGDRKCEVHGTITDKWEVDDPRVSVHGENVHRLLRCMGCETVFYHCASWDSEDWEGLYNAAGEFDMTPVIRTETFPSPEKQSSRPDWAWSLSKRDPSLGAIMDEIYRARDEGGLILPAVGLRTAFDRVTEILGIDPAMRFEEKIETIHAQGLVGETEAAALKVVVDAGSAAAHRGWMPAIEDLNKLLTALEHFIHRSVVSGKAALAVAANIPPKPARRPKQGSAAKGAP